MKNTLTVNWWLERGLAGFRGDAIINRKLSLLTIATHGSVAHDADIDAISAGDMEQKMNLQHVFLTVGEVFDEREEDIPLFIGDDELPKCRLRAQ